jgi:coenzyme F420-0:L-glutamate ligase / coenzyme F420-1:gamma-L-glutamate ligase
MRVRELCCILPSLLRLATLLDITMAKPAKPLTGRKPSSASTAIQILPILGLPEVLPGEDLPGLLVEAMRKSELTFVDGDVLVIAQKVVSKAEGRLVNLATVSPSSAAVDLASKLKKDPHFIELVLQESRRIVRSEPVLIVETHHGFVCANAGVDQSNVPGSDFVSLLPHDPDRSARHIAGTLRRRIHKRVAVIISDTFGRPWRLGLTNVAVGAAGLPVLIDLRGTRDRNGKALRATILAVADELAAAAGLVSGKSAGIPAVIIRGYRDTRPLALRRARARHAAADNSATSLIRPAHEDLFR